MTAIPACSHLNGWCGDHERSPGLVTRRVGSNGSEVVDLILDADLQTVDAGQHQIEQHHVDRGVVHDRQRRLPRRRLHHDAALVRQRRPQRQPDALVVSTISSRICPAARSSMRRTPACLPASGAVTAVIPMTSIDRADAQPTGAGAPAALPQAPVPAAPVPPAPPRRRSPSEAVVQRRRGPVRRRPSNPACRRPPRHSLIPLRPRSVPSMPGAPRRGGTPRLPIA